MEKIDLDNYLLNQKLTEEAWKSISSGFPLTHQMLKKWCKMLDWVNVSNNTNILWTIDMLEEFKEFVDWKKLSSLENVRLFQPIIIEKFKDNWDWDKLIDNYVFTPTENIIEKYADRWNWNKLLRKYQINDLYSTAFFQKYQQYIKPKDLDGSYLYMKLVEERENEIVNSLLGVEDK